MERLPCFLVEPVKEKDWRLTVLVKVDREGVRPFGWGKLKGEGPLIALRKTRKPALD